MTQNMFDVVTFQCPQCQQQLEGPTDGSAVVCPTCSKSFIPFDRAVAEVVEETPIAPPTPIDPMVDLAERLEHAAVALKSSAGTCGGFAWLALFFAFLGVLTGFSEGYAIIGFSAAGGFFSAFLILMLFSQILHLRGTLVASRADQYRIASRR